MSLWSGLFRGGFICDILRGGRPQQKADSVLLALISKFKENHNIEWMEGQNESVSVSLYVQQIWYNVLSKFKAKSVHHVIRSEFEKLSDDLKAELFHFDDR